MIDVGAGVPSSPRYSSGPIQEQWVERIRSGPSGHRGPESRGWPWTTRGENVSEVCIIAEKESNLPNTEQYLRSHAQALSEQHPQGPGSFVFGFGEPGRLESMPHH